MKERTDDIVISSYSAMASLWERRAKVGYVAMDEIFKLRDRKRNIVGVGRKQMQ